MKSTKTKNRIASLALLALFMTLAPAALARNTWYVDGVNGSDSNDCLSSGTACKTIGHAISLCSSRDTIMVAPATYTENLTISISLRITGSGAATTIVDGNQAGTVFTISSATADVRLSKLTIRNGYAARWGQWVGGGVNNAGTLTIESSIISGNGAVQYGGGVFNGGTLAINKSTISGNSAVSGGGVCSYGTMTVNKSTISGNTSGSDGGGIRNGGTLTISQSTISRNDVGGGWGGGIQNWDSGMLAVNNSTITGNHAGVGGGICDEGEVVISNSTISGNAAGAAGGGISNGLCLGSGGGSVTL